MFLGHYAVAMAAKKAAPKASLGTLFMASQLIDLIWPVFLLLGLEHVRVSPGNTVVTPLEFYDYPLTHSLLGIIGWALLFSLFYFYIKRDIRTTVIVALCVISHWILDYITHRPDLPLSPSSEKFFGLGLWNNLQATIIVEAGLFILGIMIYIKSTKAAGKKGIYGFWSLIALLLLIYAGNIFGSAPPSESAIGYVGLLGWLFIPWAYWIDNNRKFID